jgi:hypothetical protein
MSLWKIVPKENGHYGKWHAHVLLWKVSLWKISLWKVSLWKKKWCQICTSSPILFRNILILEVFFSCELFFTSLRINIINVYVWPWNQQIYFFFLLLNKLTCPPLIWLPVKNLLLAFQRQSCGQAISAIFCNNYFLKGSQISGGQEKKYRKNPGDSTVICIFDNWSGNLAYL